ncbi:hypothetical protein GCM10027423_01040 [Spirosoma arcticum]
MGFFENAAEAQQAVQLLLTEGFIPEKVSLLTPTGSHPVASDGLTAPAEADSSGRFFSSLFGDSEAVRGSSDGRDYSGPAEEPVARQRGTWVTVQVQSTTEAKQAAELLNTAGAGDVAADERPNPTD